MLYAKNVVIRWHSDFDSLLHCNVITEDAKQLNAGSGLNNDNENDNNPRLI
jgi:hypothetical protein